MYKYLQTFAIGGLQNIGYFKGTDHLVVLSTQGRGVFNCLTAEKILRNANDWWSDYNDDDNTVGGFDSLGNERVKTYGLFGGDKLPSRNLEGWELIVSDPEPEDAPFEKYTIHKVFLVDPAGTKYFVTKDGPCELRAFGFSESGKTFVIGSSCELVIWAKVE